MKNSTAAAPLWVKIGLWGIKSRQAAIIFTIISLIGGVFAGFVLGAVWFLIGLGAAAWYAGSIWWVDKNSDWES